MTVDPRPEEVDRLTAPVYGPYVFVRHMLRPDSRLLDVGCGNAKVSAFLAESGALVDGIEVDPSRAAVASSRVRHLSTVEAGQHDPDLLPAYDIITFFDVLEHFLAPPTILSWAVRRLAPRGRIVASIPNSAHYSFRLKMLHGNWQMTEWGLFDRGHLHFYDPHSMVALQPAGTRLADRRFFTPGVGWQQRALRAWPSMFALHVVHVWERVNDSVEAT